jgi:NADPH-dependent 2,4-dienoyl-CoA reductase/sulfur reductase-like enzyme
MEPVGPSPWHNPNTGDSVRPLTVGEVHEIQKLFVAAARRLKQAGYDGVEVHAANGYLFQQFFTPRINKRTDQYGGSLENRSRFLLETVARMREALDDFPLIVRLSASEYVNGGYTRAEIIELARRLEHAGVAAIDLSGGSNESPQLSKYCIQPPSFPHGCLGPDAKPIREALGIPVLVAGRIVTPKDAECVLASGAADFISLGRALYSDAHWCLKAFGRVKAPIRECIACNVCFERLTLEKDVSCVQNPMIGTEFEKLEFAEPQLIGKPASGAQRRRVLVLGAGITGLEAARVLAGRGHLVEVWERAARPGGQIHLAVVAPDKTEVEPAWTYRWKEVVDLRIPIRLNVEPTASGIKEWNPDFVVIATGARPRPIPFDISGLSSNVRIVQAWDYFLDPAMIAEGSTVTIVGGGSVGLEAADLLTTRASRVSVVEALPHMATTMARNNRMELIDRLLERGAKLHTHMQVLKAEGGTLWVRAFSEEDRELEIGDCLMIAIGPISNREVVAAVEEAGVDYALAGDAYRPGDFLSCLRDAWMVALSVDHRFRS